METLQIVFVVVAAPFVVGLPLTIIGARIFRERLLRSDLTWLLAPLVGIGAIVLIAQNLLYVNVRIPHSAALIWLMSVGGWVKVLRSPNLRSVLRPIPVIVLAGGIAIYMLHGLGLLASGADNYYGYGWVDMYNYVSQAQFFLDYSFHNDAHDYQFLRTAQFFKEDRIGQSVLHAFIAASSGADAQYSFGPTILLSPYLLFFVVYLFSVRLRLAPICRWAVALTAPALPAVATVHLECFLSQALSIPLLAAWPIAIAWLFDRPSAAKVALTGTLLAVTLAIYTEIGAAALAIAIFHIVYINLAAARPFTGASSRLRSMGRHALTLVAVLGVALLSNPYFIDSIFSIFGRVGSPNVLAGIYPWAYKAEGVARVWFGDGVALLSPRQMRIVGFFGASLILAGLSGLLFNFWKTRNNLALLAAVVGAIPLVPAALGGTNYSYQFYKLLLSVSPFYVLGIGALVFNLQSKSILFARLGKSALIGAATTIAICTGSMTYGASLLNTTLISGRGGAYMLLSSVTKEVRSYLRSLDNVTVIILWYDTASYKGNWINAWLEYSARQNRVWSMNLGRRPDGLADFVLNRTALPELATSESYVVVTWVEASLLANKLAYAGGSYRIYRTREYEDVQHLVQASRPTKKRSLLLAADTNKIQPDVWYPIWVSGTPGNASLLTASFSEESRATLRYDHWGYPPLFFFENGECRGSVFNLIITVDTAEDSLELICNSASVKKSLPTSSLFSLDAKPDFGSSHAIRALGSAPLSEVFLGKLEEVPMNPNK